MATTVTAPVSNSIALAQRFLPLLDEVYAAESKTAALDLLTEYVEWIGANTVKLFNIKTGGLGNYSRNAGFVPGDTTGTWETHTLACDRGRSFLVDVMDNDETMGLAFGGLLSTFEREHAIPEVDAYRFAKYAAGAGIKATPATITSSTDVAALIDAAQAEMNDAEVPEEGRICFVSNKAYNQLKKNITRYTLNGEGNVNQNVEMYDDVRIIKVPSARFWTGVTLAAPSNSYDAGGYTSGGVQINFLLIHPSAVLQTIKHLIPRIFSPEVVQEADAYKLNYRIYHDCFVKDAKTKGIYLHASAPATAMTISANTASISGTGTSTITVSNPVGTVTVASSDTGVCTVSISSSTVTITGVSAGSATVTIADGIGQVKTVAVTVS